MLDLLDLFKKNATALGLAADGSPTLLAVSGGLDSMVLAHLFQAAGLPFGIAHCNFGLRGAESDGDAVFVEKTAADWGVAFFVKRFDTKTYATQHGLSTQMAARDLRYAWFAEICREHGFARLATAHHLNDAVETMLLNLVRGTGLRGMSNVQFLMSNVQIPTPNAQLPTSSPAEAFPPSASLRRVRAKAENFKLQTSNSQLIRPLSAVPRADIEAYARAHDIAWREDSSNASDDYARNFVRHHVLPLLTELNPNFLRTAERTMRRLGEVEANYGWLLGEYFKPSPAPSPVSTPPPTPPLKGRGGTAYTETHTEANEIPEGISAYAVPPLPFRGGVGGGVDTGEGVGPLGPSISKPLLRLLPAPRQALHELLRPYGFSEEQARQLAENLDHIGLELHSDTGWRVLNDRTEIIVAPTTHLSAKASAKAEQPTNPTTQQLIRIQADDLMVTLPNGSRLVLLPAEPGPHFPDGREAVLVDAERLQFPLVLRAWQPGDWFQPFGMGGQRQKLQDFFVNQKLTRLDKERVWVLENGDGAIVWVLGHRMDERFRVTAQTVRGLKIGLV